MPKNVSLSMLNWHFSALRVSPRSFNLTMTFSKRKSCSFWSLPCAMMSSENNVLLPFYTRKCRLDLVLVLFGSSVNTKKKSLVFKETAVGSKLSNLSGFWEKFKPVVSPPKVKFGEYLAATYALSNLIISRDRVSGSPYCLVSPSQVNAKADVTPRLLDNNNWVNP